MASSQEQRRNHLFEGGIRLRPHLVVRGVLNGVFHQYETHLFEAEGLRLCERRTLERRRCNGYRGNPLGLEPYRVVQTARCTGASVSQCFDHSVRLFHDGQAE